MKLFENDLDLLYWAWATPEPVEMNYGELSCLELLFFGDDKPEGYYCKDCRYKHKICERK